jgi:hypothetical protein
VNLSSGGILFDAGRPLPTTLMIELSIAWPVLLHDVAPMQLVVHGKIVRSSGNKVAIQMIRHEYRTAGTAMENRGVKTGPMIGPVFRANGGFHRP